MPLENALYNNYHDGYKEGCAEGLAEGRAELARVLIAAGKITPKEAEEILGVKIAAE